MGTLLMDKDARQSYEAGTSARNGKPRHTDAKEMFHAVFKDIRMNNPIMAMEERAIYAVMEMKRGNQGPTRDFVIDYRIPPHYCLPARQRLASRQENNTSSNNSGGKSDPDEQNPDRRWYSHRRAGSSHARRYAEEADQDQMPMWTDMGSDHPGGG